MASVKEEGKQTEESGLLLAVAEERRRMATVLVEVLDELRYFREAVSQVCHF
jgi:hypothetical protein